MPTPAFENTIDLANITTVRSGDQKMHAILNSHGSSKQFVFGWSIEPIHDTNVNARHYESILAGLKEIPPGEFLTLISSSKGDDTDALQRLDERLKNTSEETQFFVNGIKARISDLTARGQRKEREYHLFSTYSVDERTQEAEDWIEKSLALIQSFFRQRISKTEVIDVEETKLLLNRALDSWRERSMLLSTKMGLKIKPKDHNSLWEYLRSKVNGKNWPMPLPHRLIFDGQKLIEKYYIKASKDKNKISVETHRLHMSSLLVNPNAVPKPDKNFYLPSQKAYVGVVRLTQLPDGFTDEVHAMKWLWDDVASQEALTDFDVVTQISQGNLKDAMQAAQKYQMQQESNQRVLNKKGSRDTISEFRTEEAGDVQLSLIQGDVPLQIAIAICIYVYVDENIKDRKKAHQQAIEKLRSQVNFVGNRFNLPAAASREDNYPWRVWLQTLPFKTEPLYTKPYDFRHQVNASAAVAFTQLVGINNRSKFGTELISEKGATPVNISLNDAFGSPRHGAFFGLSGSGKSTLVALFIIDALTQGIPVTIMDYPKGKEASTYTWLLDFFKGAIYDTGQTYNNLLEYIDLRDIPEEDHRTRLSDFNKNITNIITSLVLDGDDDVPHSKSILRSLIETGVTFFYRDKDILDRCYAAREAGIGSTEWENWPTLVDFYDFFTEERLMTEDFGSDVLKALKYVRYRLYTWLNSDLGQAISQPSSFDGSSDLTLFALRNISSEQESAILGLSAQTAAMRKAFATRRSVFYCDELSVLLRFDNLAYVIGTFLATGRAIGLSCLLASQDPVVFQSAPKDVSAQIIQNLSFKLIGRVVKGALESYERIFRYDPNILENNTQDDFLPSPSEIFSRWLVDDNERLTPCRYYPPANILGIVANNQNEVAARALFFRYYPNKYEAIGRFSKWLFERFREHDTEADSEDIVTNQHIEDLDRKLLKLAQLRKIIKEEADIAA